MIDRLEIISIHVPLAGDDRRKRTAATWVLHFYPRPPCGGRLVLSATQPGSFVFLSTSPLRGTTTVRRSNIPSACISIHVPLAGDDRRCFCRQRQKIAIFLSTSPLRGTTADNLTDINALSNFYPRPPCGGRRVRRRPRCRGAAFLSTSPLRGTTRPVNGPEHGRAISIHVPLAGDDGVKHGLNFPHIDFYPRPPCGGRRQM